MHKLIAITILISLLLPLNLVTATEQDPLDIQVKTLYSAPIGEAQTILDIPIEVKVLDISEDANWYKVKIAYAVGPFHYTYVGWTYIPVGDVLIARLGSPDVAAYPDN